MEDLLYLYAESFNCFEPIVCFDERPYQLLDDIVEPLACKPEQKTRIDYQYSREGTCNLFVFYALHYGWRHVEVTEPMPRIRRRLVLIVYLYHRIGVMVEAAARFLQQYSSQHQEPKKILLIIGI